MKTIFDPTQEYRTMLTVLI